MNFAWLPKAANFAGERDLLKTKIISQREFGQSRANMEAMDAAVQAFF